MVNRRLLRIKVLQEIYAHLKSNSDSINASEKELFYSIDRSYQLYYYIFQLLLELRKTAEKKLEVAQKKKIPSYEDLHPNKKFVENRVLQQLENSETLGRYIEKNKISWVHYPEYIKNLFNRLAETDLYIQYMENKTDSYQEDKKFIAKLLEKFLLYDVEFYDILEERSVYWNDEVDFIISMATSFVKKLTAEQEDIDLLPKYKNEEDVEFTKTLFRKTLLNHTNYQGIIKEFTYNWDVERIAYLDNLMMAQAICEVTQFPSIPVKVTINEYIEMAKLYSTQNSGNFINGILDKIIHKLREEGKINKQGRGLIGES